MTTSKEYEDTLRTNGATAAAWEGASLWLRHWRFEHPDDERDDLELLLADDTLPARESDLWTEEDNQ